MITLQISDVFLFILKAAVVLKFDKSLPPHPNIYIYFIKIFYVKLSIAGTTTKTQMRKRMRRRLKRRTQRRRRRMRKRMTTKPWATAVSISRTSQTI